jgi:putative ABC transport system permease protein
MATYPLAFEFRLAWRETRPVLRKFLFLTAAISLGVGSVTGIKGFSRALDRAMARSARDLIASDIAVRFNQSPSPPDLRFLEQALTSRGAALTRVTETLSMASAGSPAQPLLSTVKAVDPESYPFYGTLELEPAGDFRKVLTDDTAVVTREFLIRTRASLGDTLQVGTARFRIAAVLSLEPDRIASGMEIAPRIIITRNGLRRSGLIQFGSRASESFLYRLPPRLGVDQAREVLVAGVGREGRVSDYRNPNPSVARGLDRTANFLSLIGLLALLVGGLGVATTMHSYLQQKLDNIAVLKCLGGRSLKIIRIYLIQGLFLGIAGSVIGVCLGYVLQLVLPPFLEGFIRLPAKLEPAPAAVLQGFSIGTLTTLLFLLPPLLAIRRVRPTRVFLREMPETRLSTLERLRHDPLPLFSTIVLLIGVGLVASWLAESWVRGFVFMGGLAAAILVLAAAARILLLGLKRMPRLSSLVLRHGLKNLQRPGSHVTSVLVSLGIGVAFTLTVYLIQTSLIPQIIKSAPGDFPNLFLIGITDRDRDPLWQFLKAESGVMNPGRPIPAIPARLRSVDGKRTDQLNLPEGGRHRFEHEFVLSWSESTPPDTRIVEGRWWTAPYEPASVSVARDAAHWMNIGIGSVLEFESSGQVVRGRVTNIREFDFPRPGTNNQFIFSPGALSGLPASYVGGIQVSPSRIAVIQRDLFERFPAVTSIDVGQIISRVQTILDRIANAVRFIALFAIFAGVITLASSVASTRFQRIREAVLLKTLGATRSLIARIQAAEFLIIGVLAGFIGSLLASAAARYLLGKLLETDYEFRWLPVLAGTLVSAGLAIVTGWLASRGILKHRPLEVLREN